MIVKILTVTVDAPMERVYAFASNPANMPLWAPAFVKSIAQVNGEWVIDSNMGPVHIAFAPPNPFGVLDHVVTLPSGEVFNNPMRVVPNGAGSLVTFTLFRQPGMSDAEFARDAGMIESDLQALKRAVDAAPERSPVPVFHRATANPMPDMSNTQLYAAQDAQDAMKDDHR